MNLSSNISAWRALTDEQFLAQCRLEVFRGSGPGGQKRNKTSSGVRIVHEPSGLSGLASELRSQALNRRRALARLRHRMAIEMRQPVNSADQAAPPWLGQLIDADGRLAIPRNAERYLQALACVLDVLSAHEWSISRAAASFEINTANLVKFLAADTKAWAKVNQMRQSKGLRPLVQKDK